MGLKTADIRNMTTAEIDNRLLTLREELYKLRFEQKSGRVEKPHRIHETKVEIARCCTILREKANAE
ncbi:MAG: 50S ribosomal protein L29 [Candidatus Omnitrophota bacterium]